MDKYHERINCAEINEINPANITNTINMVIMMLNARPNFQLSSLFTTGDNNIAKKAAKASGIKMNFP